MLIRAATRGSPLARWQTDRVAELLRATDPSIEVDVVEGTDTGELLDDPVHLEQLHVMWLRCNLYF